MTANADIAKPISPFRLREALNALARDVESLKADLGNAAAPLAAALVFGAGFYLATTITGSQVSDLVSRILTALGH